MRYGSANTGAELWFASLPPLSVVLGDACGFEVSIDVEDGGSI
jgi:hypothetical protein